MPITNKNTMKNLTELKAFLESEKESLKIESVERIGNEMVITINTPYVKSLQAIFQHIDLSTIEARITHANGTNVTITLI